jgi:hypothetical protein
MNRARLIELAELLQEYVEHARVEHCERGVAEANAFYKRVNKEARGREYEICETAGVK